jgi:outer membrane lipoprotein-sorting protein|tara:strand:- start:1924 stop:2562 length:639 start_codon:yes stop_codon:yes gene_type:complete
MMMTTHNFSRTFLSLITLLLLFHFLYSEDNLLDVEVVDKVKSSILSADGHSFKVVWTYEYDGDIWTGEGSMKVLGQDYLKLNLDYQQILIKHDTLFTRYEETNQVVADWFDRTDPANFFSILLGEMPGFTLDKVDILTERQIDVTLCAETMVGFDTLRMIVDRETWLPVSMSAVAGEDIRVDVKIKEAAPLINPLELTNKKLPGSEFIDLRE